MVCFRFGGEKRTGLSFVFGGKKGTRRLLFCPGKHRTGLVLTLGPFLHSNCFHRIFQGRRFWKMFSPKFKLGLWVAIEDVLTLVEGSGSSFDGELLKVLI